MNVMWQRVLQTINWFLDNPGDATLLGGLALIARKLFLSEIARVIQMGRDEELIWTRKRVEALTGDRWNGPQPILKRVRTQYIVNYYSYLLRGLPLVDQLKRRTNMNKAWLVTLVTYILAQVAIRTGVIIPTEVANWIVDGLMLLIPIALAFMNKTKETKVTEPQQPKPQLTDPDNFIQG